MTDGAEQRLSGAAFLSGQALPGAEDARVFAELKEAPCRRATPFLFAWWWALSGIPLETRESWGKPAAAEKKPAEAEKKPAEAKELTADDLFGDADDSAPAAPAKKPAAPKAKPAVVLKSRVVFDVKGFEVEQDFHALGEKIIREINEDGLVWQKKFEVLPLAYGMNKLKMTMTIEDDKTSADDILERIAAWEDEVQSCDIVDFHKA